MYKYPQPQNLKQHNHDNLVVPKTLNGRKAYTVISISFVTKWQWVLDIVVEHSGKKKEWEKWHFRYRILLRLAAFHEALGHLYESCWS